ncbi:MAG: hypothetical protein HON53_24525 [Planctomycetaceae bacterium]|jgi:hypothetical protein|nr:hypothetical protein [Planctomycetaceae bacterium]MBT6154483.1 hypothetical protein [Planctomycetaceae bacterium]MBT6486513.1 hypothetical protein [Planctomycetaceae bacterium]MBT6497940.1 hypothetical protein [Planctomycetaceae bacterium]
MQTDRREFIKLSGAAGAGLIAVGGSAANNKAALLASSQKEVAETAFMTELFLDNKMIEAAPGVSRRLHQPRKHLLNPVVRCDRWCDGNIIQPYTTMYDQEDKLFKMWARTGSDRKSMYLDGHAAYMTYFTSTDGVHWNKPDLGVMEIAGRRDHNIIFTSDSVSATRAAGSQAKKSFVVPTQAMTPQGKKAFFWGVNKHPNPRNAGEKFVALAIVQDHRRGAHIVTSPDGIHWSCASAPFWQTPNDVSGKGDDCLMHLMYDKAKQKWVVYRRIIPEFSERMVANESDCDRQPVGRYYRSYAYAESDDLREWKNHQFILSMDPDDPPDTELYQFGCHKLGQTYVGYISVYYRRSPQPINVHLATSRDGINFTRVCRGEPFIPHGSLGYYDYMAMACSQPEPVIVDDTVYVYYAALNYPHNADVARTDPGDLQCGAALATFKRDRFASLETSEIDPGPCHVVTKPFTVQHSKLFLNAATWMRGSIRVEALTRDWQPIEGFTKSQSRSLQGDALNHPVRWNANTDVSKLLGKEIRLKFHMTRARLHAMTLSNEDRKLGAVESESEYGKPADSTPTTN